MIIQFDTEKDNINDLQTIINNLKNNNQGQQTLQTNTEPNNGEKQILIVVRDGEKHTKDVKETLKTHGFNYWAKTKSGKEDPRWSAKMTKEEWNAIADNECFTGLSVWDSSMGEN